MKSWLIFALVLALGVIPTRAQTSTGDSKMAPRDVVEQLWSLAIQGDLLTNDGWQRASRLYTNPGPWPGNKVIRVVSDQRGLPEESPSTKDKTADVVVWYATEAGYIDSSLRYTPPKLRSSGRAFTVFHLSFQPAHMLTFGLDGKTLLTDKPGPEEWRIHGPQGYPWTTVNTAIRYVLEVRNKTTDPNIKSNADKTLAELLKLD